MAHTKSKLMSDVKAKKHTKSGAELILQITGRNHARLPAHFKKVLLEEFDLLPPPRPTPKYPFKSVRPWAEESEYVQTGVGLGDYLFTDVDYAIIRYMFGTDDLNNVSKSRLKDLLVTKCNIPYSELQKCSWLDIREFLLSVIEAEYATQQSRKAQSRKRKVKVKQQTFKKTEIKNLFKINEAQVLFDGKDLGLPSNAPVLILEKLVSSFGEVVKHKKLEQNSTPSSASEALKGLIAVIRKAFTRHNVPCQITAKRGIGYVLQQIQTPSH